MLTLLHLSVLLDGATLYVGDLLRFDPAGGGGSDSGVWTDLSGGPLSNPPSGRAFLALNPPPVVARSTCSAGKGLTVVSF